MSDDGSPESLLPEQVLSDKELREYCRKHRPRSDNCEDGYCGGCPACLDAQNIEAD